MVNPEIGTYEIANYFHSQAAASLEYNLWGSIYFLDNHRIRHWKIYAIA